MGESPGGKRVLVVDDADQMRDLIRRALNAHGYRVDVAATLAEAHRMNPVEYDAVLVDAHLGDERGTDLIEAMLAQDPAAAQRCLVITGGSADSVPDGIAWLLKPFRPGQLLDAVRERHQPGDSGGAPPARPAPWPAPGAVTGQTRANPPAPGRPGPARAQPETSRGDAWQVLAAAGELRARERADIADFLHDGPVQDLTAALLGLHTLSSAAVSDQTRRVHAVAGQLEAASGALRRLIDAPLPVLHPGTSLAAAVAQRTAWLTDTPAVVEDRTDQPAPGPAVIAGVVELMLAAMVPQGRAAQAHVTLTSADGVAWVELTLPEAPPAADPATARQALGRFAAALGGTVRADLGPRCWRAGIALPASPAGHPGGVIKDPGSRPE